jgi:hypothetical protein
MHESLTAMHESLTLMPSESNTSRLKRRIAARKQAGGQVAPRERATLLRAVLIEHTSSSEDGEEEEEEIKEVTPLPRFGYAPSCADTWEFSQPGVHIDRR